MDLSLNFDVLLHLIKFVDPVDRFNLVLSGILKGFENVNEGIDLRQRIERFGIELGPCRDGTCQLEIRSLKDRCNSSAYYPVSHVIVLERLVERGFLFKNRQLMVDSCCKKWPWPSLPRLLPVLRSMNNLEKLSLLEWKLTLTDVPKLFRSCPELTELHLKLDKWQTSEMNEELINKMRPGFQRLRLFELHVVCACSLHCVRHSAPVIQEILSCLNECVQLTLRNRFGTNLVIDGYLTLNPDLSQNLHTLKIYLTDEPTDLHNEIAHLKKLKDLLIVTSALMELACVAF